MTTKTNLLQKLTLLLITAITIISCSTEEIETENVNDEGIDYSELNKETKLLAESFKKEFKVEDIYHKIANFSEKESASTKSFEQMVFESEVASLEDEVLVVTFNTSEFFLFQERVFLEDFFNDMSNSYDVDLLSVITAHRTKLSNGFFLPSSRSKINLVLDASEISFSLYEEMIEDLEVGQRNAKSWDDFASCMAKQGKKFGRGVAGGAIVGAAVGGIAGAAAGGVGAVPGAVYGAAHGAVRGGALALFWSTVDCAQSTLAIDELDTAEYFDGEYDSNISIIVLSEDFEIDFNLNP